MAVLHLLVVVLSLCCNVASFCFVVFLCFFVVVLSLLVKVCSAHLAVLPCLKHTQACSHIVYSLDLLTREDWWSRGQNCSDKYVCDAEATRPSSQCLSITLNPIREKSTCHPLMLPSARLCLAHRWKLFSVSIM